MSDDSPVSKSASRTDFDAAQFVTEILNDCNQFPGCNQALRSGLGKRPGAALRSHRFVVPKLPNYPRPDMEWACYTIAGLIATHDPLRRMRVAVNETPLEEGDGEAESEEAETPPRRENLGVLAARVDLADDLAGSCERRLHSVLQRRELEGFHRDLIRLVRLIVSQGFIPNWDLLWWDISRWSNPLSREQTMRNWSYAYYRTIQKENN